MTPLNFFMIVAYGGHRISIKVQNISGGFWRRCPLCILGTALNAIEVCDKDTFPMINSLIYLPVSVARTKSYFLILRRPKTQMNIRMVEDRL